jgi:HSP20 family protein
MLVKKTSIWEPVIELQETEAELILKAEVSGVRTKDVKVKIESKTILITGEHCELSCDPQSFICHELHYGKFQRVIPLPKPVRFEQAIAELIDGVLTVIMPKS